MPERQKYIAHFDLDSFFVSVERLLDPSLAERDASGKMKPVVVGGSPEGRGVVASASYEARAFGVRSAMPMKTALRLCPHLVIVRGRHGEYSRMSARIISRLRDFVPVIEQTSIDEGYMDLTGCEKLFHNDFGGALKMLQDLVDREFMLPISFGMGSTRIVAKIASGKAKPHGILVVAPGDEKRFLGALPIGDIPGIGPKTEERLRLRSIQFVHQIQSMSEKELTQHLGKYGEDLYRIVQGLSSSAVTPESDRKSISSEETFPEDLSPDYEFEPVFAQHIEEICHRLRSIGRKAATVTVKIRYKNFTTLTRSKSIHPTSDDATVKEAALALFDTAYDHTTPVRLIGVGLSNFIDPTSTPDLFETRETKRDSVLQTIDAIRKKHGIDSIKVGTVRKRDK
jgi:DNA polymerase IV